MLTAVKILIEIILVVALVIGYINEDKIVNWEREVFFPKVKEWFAKIFTTIMDK